MPFHTQLLTEAQDVWSALLAHPFLKQTADGSIDEAAFANWMRQDYVFVGQGLKFIGALLAKAPEDLVRPLAEAVPALVAELELFERMASEKGVPFDTVEVAPTCHAYCQFLMATASQGSFEEGFALLYGVEKAYFDSWSWVRQNLRGASPWQPFIEKWSDRNFAQWVHWIETSLDRLADEAGDRARERMTEIFLLAGQYELLFWDMALEGESWPG
jgi:thiaminase/transcriptional activator TenA